MYNASINHLNTGASNENNWVTNNNRHRGGKACLNNRLKHAEIEAGHCLRDEIHNIARGTQNKQNQYIFKIV